MNRPLNARSRTKSAKKKPSLPIDPASVQLITSGAGDGRAVGESKGVGETTGKEGLGEVVGVPPTIGTGDSVGDGAVAETAGEEGLAEGVSDGASACGAQAIASAATRMVAVTRMASRPVTVLMHG